MIPHDDRGYALNLVGHTPTIINKTLTNATTEYAQALPAGTKRFTLQARTAIDVRLAYVTGETATNYITIKSGSSYSEEGIDGNYTLYLYNAAGGTIVEIIAWT